LPNTLFYPKDRGGSADDKMGEKGYTGSFLPDNIAVPCALRSSNA